MVHGEVGFTEAGIDECYLNGLGNTHLFEDWRQITVLSRHVSYNFYSFYKEQGTSDLLSDDTIAHPVQGQGHSDEDEQSLSIAGRSQEVEVSGLLTDNLSLNGSCNLSHFELDKRVTLVPIGVIRGKNLESLFLPAVFDQPL